MTEFILTKVTAKTAAEIVEVCQLQQDAALENLTLTPAQFFQQLLNQKQWSNAVRFLAHGLPKREAVWWAYVCVQSILVEPILPEVKQVLETVKQWVYQPNEVNRRATQTMTEKVKHEHPASWVGLAAFWSEGSIAAPDAPVVIPIPTLTAHAVAGAIMLAAVQEPKEAEQHYQRFLQRGVHIANGGNGLIDTI